MPLLNHEMQAGIALEKQGHLTEALQYYMNLKSSHPAIILRIGYIAQKIGEIDLAEKMHKVAAINQLGHRYDKLAAESHLPNKVILLAGYTPWFPFSVSEVTELLEQQDYRLIETSVVMPPSTSLVNLTPDTAIKYLYKNISLFAIASYESCVFLELTHPDELDPHNLIHWNFLQPSLKRAAAFIDYYFLMCQFYKPKFLVYPQGYMPASAAMRLVAQNLRIKTIAFEFTCFKDKILCENYTGISVTHNSVRDTFKEKDKNIIQTDADNFWQTYYRAIMSYKNEEHISPQTEIDNSTLNQQQKNILYLGQVGTDSSVLFGSNNFSSQARLILDIAHIAMSNGHRFVVKLHPKEKDGIATIDAKPYHQLTLRKMQEQPDFYDLIQNEDFIIDADNSYSTYSLIEQSDVCITINSQAGLEAACLGKPVVVCGQCMYENAGFTQRARSKSELQEILQKILVTQTPVIDPDRARRFFYSYLNYSSIERQPNKFIDLLMALEN